MKEISFKKRTLLMTKKELSHKLVNIVKSYLPKHYRYIGYARSVISESHYFAVIKDDDLYIFRISSHKKNAQAFDGQDFVTGDYYDYNDLGQHIKSFLLNNQDKIKIEDKHLLALYIIWRTEEARQYIKINEIDQTITLNSTIQDANCTWISPSSVKLFNSLNCRSLLYYSDENIIKSGALGRRFLDYMTQRNSEMFFNLQQQDNKTLIDILTFVTKNNSMSLKDVLR
ncbi:hypothetical protein [Enterococcus casseliflavus]|uniref:hypothetical protein n=1 Tax=Enterococcus casseliflavus TaxID=37734 RepID=UPI00301ADFB5